MELSTVVKARLKSTNISVPMCATRITNIVNVRGNTVGALVTLLYQNHTPILLMEAQSQEEFARRVKALPRHAVDDHTLCDFHPLVTCSCGACKDKDQITCKGVEYRTKFRLDCKFHALLYEIVSRESCSGRETDSPHLKTGHSNAVEVSHNVFIRFRSKDISLQRLHYHLSTNLALLQANLTL
jgi:hypothetical protein